MKSFALSAGVALAFAFVLMDAAGCSDKENGGPPTDASHEGRARLSAPIHPQASCDVEIASPDYLPAVHVPVGTDVTYNSNPPSSGNHYPDWAAFQEYSTPVPRGYYVHDLEHGAVVILYKCGDDSGCPDIVDGLRRAMAQIPDDPKCRQGGPRNRLVLTPDPLLDVPVAAAAWGWTYKAQCVDQPTLVQFIKDNYGQGTEDFCTNGKSDF
jgi:hypothetical protein